MPRLTRAAQRVLEDEQAVASDIPLPATPLRERAPLGDITGSQAQSPMIRLEVNLEKPAKKTAKGKKSKGAKKTSRKAQDKENADVVDDDSQSDESAAVEEACRHLMGDGMDGEKAAVSNSGSTTPPSPAVLSLMKHLSFSNPQTPKFDPELHRTPETKRQKDGEDSFVGTIETRTPMIVREPSADFSSPKPIRIEDSVEALDALNDAVEEVSASLPTLAVETIQSDDCIAVAIAVPQAKLLPDVKAKQNATATSITASTTTTKPGTLRRKLVAQTIKKDVKPRTPLASMKNTRATSTPNAANLKATPVKPIKMPAVTVTNPLTPAVKSAKPITPAAKSTKPATPVLKRNVIKTETSNTAPNPMARARLSSIHKAPFVPTKSTKAPTTSNFVLPGEAISQKLKAQREERQKREEEDAKRRREFKGKPIRTSIAPVVKMTATASARINIAAGKSAAAEKVNTSTTTRTSMGTVPLAKPYGSMRTKPTPISVAKRTSLAVLAHQATQSPATAAVNPSVRLTTSTRRPSSGPVKTTTPTGTISKSKGKEIFARGMVSHDVLERERKAKEEAARKARVEAAERGRVASREWAEKMKARKASLGQKAAVAAT